MTFIRPSKLLKQALVADAAVSSAVGVLQVAVTPWLVTVLSLPASLLLGTGLFMLGYAGLLIVMAVSRTLPKVLVQVVVFGNVGWGMAGGWVLVASGFHPTGFGIAFVGIHIVGVLVLALAEYLGLGQSAPSRPATAAVA